MSLEPCFGIDRERHLACQALERLIRKASQLYSGDFEGLAWKGLDSLRNSSTTFPPPLSQAEARTFQGLNAQLPMLRRV